MRGGADLPGLIKGKSNVGGQPNEPASLVHVCPPTTIYVFGVSPLLRAIHLTS